MVHTLILFGKEAENPCSSHDDLKAPTVFTGMRMRAQLRVYHDKRHQCPMFDKVQLLLKGQVSSQVTLGGVCWKIEKPLVRMSCVKTLQDFQEKESDVSNLVSNESSFFFDIPEYVTLPSLQGKETKEALQPLPPSLRVLKKTSNEWLVGKRSGVCDVTYHVEAKFFLKGRSVDEWRREILVMPVGEAPPPMDPEDLKREYTLAAAQSLGPFWKRKRGALLIGSSVEPQPFVIQATTRKSLIPGTDLLLNFTTRTIQDARIEAGFSEPQLTTCEIIITMEAITFFQESEQESVMSLVEARNNQLAVMKTTKFAPQIRKMSLGRWHKTGEAISGSNRVIEWTTSTAVKALIPYDAPKLPSFFSSLVSRRYAFDIEIRFGTGMGIKSQKPMRLRIPVQMVHARLQKGWGDLPDAEFEDDPKVPAYIP